MYNLASACIQCAQYEETDRLPPFNSWSADCSASHGLVTVFNNYSVPGVGNHVPSWAYGNLTSDHMFSLEAAVRGPYMSLLCACF
jgi:hypothetical protein